MTPDTFDKVLSGVRIFFVVVAIISFLSGRWLDLIIAVLMAIYGGIFISVFFGSYVNRPSDKQLNQTVIEKSIDNIRNIRSAPKGTINDMVLAADGNSYYPDMNRTIDFADIISGADLEESINFLVGLCEDEFPYERLRRMMMTQKGKPIKFTCQAHLVFAARGAARRLSYWRKPELSKSLANKDIYPWSYDGSFPRFESPDSLEFWEDKLKLQEEK